MIKSLSFRTKEDEDPMSVLDHGVPFNVGAFRPMGTNRPLALTLRSRCRIRLLLFLCLSLLLGYAEGGKKKVSIPDDLDDVVDDEEDEDWKRWGQKRTTKDDLPPQPDFSKMRPSEIQAEIMKSHTGPSLGFVKLRPGVPRSSDDVPLIAMRWSKVLRTGAVEVKFMAVDRNTIMFTMERGQDLEELKEFVLSQPEAYEMKVGEQLYRRAGDPPLDEVVASLRKEAEAKDSGEHEEL